MNMTVGTATWNRSECFGLALILLVQKFSMQDNDFSQTDTQTNKTHLLTGHDAEVDTVGRAVVFEFNVCTV